MNDVHLSDSTNFPFWTETTEYSKIYHVATAQPNATDSNPGTRQKPFQTIGRAAELLQPGEKVIIHAGIYRECVRPVRGGSGPDKWPVVPVRPRGRSALAASARGQATDTEGTHPRPSRQGLTPQANDPIQPRRQRHIGLFGEDCNVDQRAHHQLRRVSGQRL